MTTIKMREYRFNDGEIVTTTEILNLVLDETVLRMKTVVHKGLAEVVEYDFNLTTKQKEYVHRV